MDASRTTNEPNTEPPVNKTRAKPRTELSCGELEILGVDSQVAEDFLSLRKTKRSPVTKTAIEGIRREALKAGLSLNDALSICCEKGWQGFDSAWLQGKGARASPKGGNDSRSEDRKRCYEALTGTKAPRIEDQGNDRLNRIIDITPEAPAITSALG
jgi:hypothetical protein